MIEQNLDPLLSGDTCEKLLLIKRIQTASVMLPLNKNDFVEQYSKRFNGLGKLPGQFSIKMKDDYIGVIQPNRRIPFGLYDRLKVTLSNLEQRGIISKVDYPTEFVNALIIVEKPNGNLRLCIDPKQLNNQIQREHYMIPTSDDISSRLVHKKVFTVIDLREGFWQVELDEKSSDLCCFNSPFGRFKFNLMPFGIYVAPEVFHKKMSQIFGVIDGVEVYFDDLIVAAETEIEHDKILREVMQVAEKYNVTFNVDKLQYKEKSVHFMGHLFSADGVRPDPKHVEAIKQLKTPTDKTSLLSVLGLFKYVAKFVENMSTITAPLRELTKDNVPFEWNEEHEDAFNKLKAVIASEPILAYYDKKKQCIIQADASKDGLGCCLLQDGHPIAFSSRALTKAEQRYAQIEKELLAVVFASEKFHQFVYGQKIKVLSDHKPLVSIMKKDINKVSTRLQRMLLRLLKYDIEMEYLPGKEMYIADALSRNYINDPVEEDKEMLYIVHNMSQNISISGERRKEFQASVKNDPILSKVAWIT